MKHLFTSILSILILSSCANVPAQVATGPQTVELSLESTNLTARLGVIPEGQRIERTFVIRNKLQETILVEAAYSTCECIQVKVRPQSVKSGEVFELVILFDTTGDEGETENVVYIETDSLVYELIRFQLNSNIVVKDSDVKKEEGSDG